VVVTGNGTSIRTDYGIMQYGKESREAHTRTDYNNIPA
jgi:hypothetical protein